MKEKKMPGRVLSARPVMSSILVEHISAQDIKGGIIELKEDTDLGETPQAYIVAIGPSLDTSKLGFGVGDRVIVQGNFVPVPKIEGVPRRLGIVEVHNIKAVLEE